MPKTEGATSIVQRQMHRWTKEIVTKEEYEAAIKELIRISVEGKTEKDRLRAIEMLQLRIEGKLPETILHHIQNNLTIDDILPKGNDEE